MSSWMVSENRTMPVHTFGGKWVLPFDPTFSADKVNFVATDDHSSVEVDSSQVSASARYKNRQDKNIDYVLIIQRSTGAICRTLH